MTNCPALEFWNKHIYNIQNKANNSLFNFIHRNFFFYGIGICTFVYRFFSMFIIKCKNFGSLIIDACHEFFRVDGADRCGKCIDVSAAL